MRKILFFMVLLFLFCGCNGWMVQPEAPGIPEPLLEPNLVDALVETVTALSVATAASAPVNPWSAPIGIGLAGVIAMLEALRRKERSARKFAENGNHVSNKT